MIIGQWYKFNIKQMKNENEEFIYTIEIDNVKVYEVTNTDARKGLIEKIFINVMILLCITLTPSQALQIHLISFQFLFLGFYRSSRSDFERLGQRKWYVQKLPSSQKYSRGNHIHDQYNYNHK